jgi:hypothetical protein
MKVLAYYPGSSRLPIPAAAWQFILNHPSIVLALGLAGIFFTLVLWRNRHKALAK